MADATGETQAGQQIIELRHVDKWYGEFQVLKDINLEVAKGERVVGPLTGSERRDLSQWARIWLRNSLVRSFLGLAKSS